MKKIILWVLLAAVVIGAVIGVAVSVNNTTDPQQTEAPTNATTSLETTSVDDVIAYLKSIYKDDGAKTPIDFERYGIVRIAGVPYEVVWTADVGEEFIKVVVNDDGTVTIDVNEECAADTPYVLTATVTDENGNTASHSWNYILPEAVDMIAIVKAAYALKPGESLPYESTLRGKITTIKTPYDPSYKNITVIIEIEGAEDMPIECYRLKGEGADELQIGDIITVTGTLKNYNGTIEFDAGCILEQVIPGERVKAPSDPKQIVDEAYALGANKSLPYEATLTGTIISVDQAYDEFYGNITVTIEIEGREGKPIKCYRMKGSGVDKIGVNDLITVRGYITNYVGSKGHSTIEFVAGCILEAWEDREAPVAPSDPKAIVDAAYALGANQTLRYEAVLTGRITKVGQEYDPNFGNITVTIVVDGREDKPIVCYRMKGNGVSKIENGDIITVKGYITNYVGDKGYSTIEYTAGCQLVSYQKNTIKAPTDMVQIVKDAYALPAGSQLPYRATLTGRVTMVNTAYDSSFDNITVTIEVDGTTKMPIKCYRLKGEGVSKIDIGNIITVTGYIEKYKHSSGDTEVEFVQGCQMTSWSQGNAVAAPTDPIQIVKEAYALEPGKSLAYKATLTGTITKVKTAYDSGYNNVTVIMEVAGTKDMPITCYRMKGNGASKIGVGDIITVSGYITKFEHSSGDWEVEFTAGCSLDKWMHADGTTEPDEPEVPVTPPTGFEANLVNNPKAGVAYKMAMNKKGSFLFFNGQTDGAATYRLGTSMDPTAAVDVYLEAVSGVKNGYRLYFMNGNTKTYIRVYERTKEDGTLSGSLEMVTKAPAEYFTYDTTAKTLVYTKGENSYYMGTYSTYTTFSVSSTYYITGDKASSVDESQFPARFYTVKVDENYKPTEPTEPEVTEPTDPVTPPADSNATLVQAPKAGEVYKFGMIQEAVSTTDVYYLAGGMSGFYMATTNNAVKAIDVYLEETKGGYYLYTLDGASKLYINMVVSADGAHVNGAYEAAASTVYTYDADMGTIVASINNGVYRFGTRNDKTYTTIGPVDVEKGNFYCKFYTLNSDTDPTEPTEPEVTEPATEPTEPEVTEPTTPPETSSALNTGDKVVIFAPAYNKALSAEKVAQYYNKGVDITVTNGNVSGYSDAEIWTVTKNGDGTYSFANGGQNIGLADTFSSMSQGAIHDDWQIISLGGSLYNLKNVGRGNFMEWYASKDNWSTYDSEKADTDDQFQLSFFVIGKGILEEEVKPTEPTTPTEPEVTEPEVTEPSVAPTEPEVTEPSVKPEDGLVAEPQVGVAYKMGMNKNDGNILFFNGQTESASVTFRLATTTNTAEAIDVYLEAVEGVEGGYRLYFMNGDTKTYIRVFHFTDGNPGYGKGSLEFVTSAPVEYFTYDSVAKTLVYDYDGNNAYYLGTYSTFTTFSVSNTSYITGDKAGDVDVKQFPARFYAAGVVEEPEATKPTEPEVTEPSIEPTEPAVDVLTIPEANELGKAQGTDNYTTDKYKITGVITDVYQTTYGNMKLTDENGNIFTVYGTYSEDGAVRYDALEVKPVVGDTITVFGIIGNYKGDPQMKNGWIIAHIPGIPEETDPSEKPDAEISFADVANRTSITTEQQVWQQNGITFTNDKAGSKTNVADYKNPVRLYQNSKITIAAKGMTKIVVTCNSEKDYAAELVNSIPATTGVTVTRDGKVVTIVFDNAVDSFVVETLVKQVRIDSIGVFN